MNILKETAINEIKEEKKSIHENIGMELIFIDLENENKVIT
jgi:hypothetical protein